MASPLSREAWNVHPAGLSWAAWGKGRGLNPGRKPLTCLCAQELHGDPSVLLFLF